jgi:4-amino-4-deoxy-L-arabinose transferase-like glycosyltransferase
MPRARRHALVFLVISLYCLLVLPRMLSYGMFIDGVTYASIARNMAENYGSFWQPYYTATVYPTFYEHPPLGFWLQSWAYRLCGDSLYVEAWWGFCVGTLILLVLAGIWRCLTPQGYALAGAWFPIMLFIVTPMTSWALANNMLENTMTFFILLSVLLCLLSLKNPTIFFSCLYGILSGLSMFGAILIKGPVALFPLAVPFISMLHDAKKIIKVSTTAIILLITLIVSFSFMLSTNTASLHFFRRYVSRQVLASITGAPETSASRFAVLTVVGRESLVPLLVGGTLAAAIYRLRRTAISSIHSRLFMYSLGIALAGSLPILVSVKQKRWYAFPSLPFYAMAIAVVFNDAALALEKLVEGNKNVGKNVIIFSSIILCIALSIMFVEKDALRGQKDFHADFSKQNRAIEGRKVISVYPTHLAMNWTLVANMQRKFRASLSEHFGQEYLLTTTDYIDSEYISSHYKRIPPFNTKKYVFFKLND